MNDNEKRIIASEIAKLYLITSTPMPESTIEAWFSVISDKPFERVLAAIKKEIVEGEGRPDARSVLKTINRTLDFGTLESKAKYNEPY